MSHANRGAVDLFGCGVLPFLFSLPSLGLQLMLHVLDIPGQAVAVEIVVTGCFGKGLLLLEGGGRWDTVSTLPRAPLSVTCRPPGPKRVTHLETIEADDALAMGDVVICENFLPFLRGEKKLFK